jgi:hypothetical protein
VKKALTVSLAGVALAATMSLVGADSFKRGQPNATDALPANDILTTVRSMGLDPTTEPLRRGPYYVLHAYDPRGIEVRIVANAQLGDILSVTPAHVLNNAYAPSYERGPRIIHVPQRGERDERASINDRDEPVTPFPRHRTTPRWPLRGDAPSPPPGPRRNVQSAAPCRAEGPTPIRPIPRFNAKAADVDKSSAPDNAAAASDVSTPPFDNTLPRGNYRHGALSCPKRKRPGCPGRCRRLRLMLRC